MNVDIAQIRQRLNYYTDTLYNATRSAQTEDETFYRDTFQVPWIKQPLVVSRTGAGAELIDVPVTQLASTVMKVYRPAAKDTDTSKASATRISKMMNSWVTQIMKQNPNPKLESFKNELLRGEMWIQTVHNPLWAKGLTKRRGLPVHFIIREPMVIYASPNEDENGIPEEVFVYYERMPWVVQALYPAWTNPKRAGSDNKEKQATTWMEHWTSKTRYFEADEEPVLPDDTNPYGIVPFIHKIASFGKSSDEGRMEDLIVGRLRKYRDLLKRDASSTSDIDSIIHMYADPSLDVRATMPDAEIPKNFREEYVFGAGRMNKIPYGVEVKRGIDMLPSAEVLQWNYAIQGQLGRKNPSALSGVPAGTSGRLQDMTYNAAIQAYSVEIANLENAFAGAFGMALRIMEGWNSDLLIPEGVKKDDIDQNYEVAVELKSEDPVERDRKVMAGRTMVSAGMRSLRTFLIKDCDMIESEAEDEIDQILAERYMFQSPDIAELMQLRAAEKSGMMGDLQAIKARRQEVEKKIKQFPLGSQIGSLGGETRMGNIKTETGMEMADVAMTQGGTRSTAMMGAE